MSRFNGIKVQGLKETQNILEKIAPKHARSIARSTNLAVAGELKKQTKKNIKTRGIEKSGNLRNSIKSRRLKSPPDKPVAAVFADSGKSAKNDGYYWRFIEHGTRISSAVPFLAPATEFIRSNLESIYREKFLKKLLEKVKREQKKFKK